jgi:hypothetical protein
MVDAPVFCHAVFSFLRMMAPTSIAYLQSSFEITSIIPIGSYEARFINLTVCNLLDQTILVDMDVQPLGLVVHGAHRVGLEDAVFLGEVGLREGLETVLLAADSSQKMDEGEG